MQTDDTTLEAQDELLRDDGTPVEDQPTAGDRPEGGEGHHADQTAERLYAGKYTSVEEMERAFVEQQKLYGRQTNELGDLRRKTQELEQKLAPPAPEKDPREAEVERLHPLVQTYKQMGFDESDAWTMAVVADQHAQTTAKSLVERELAPLKSLVNQSVTPTLYHRAVERVLADTGLELDAAGLSTQIAAAIPQEQFIAASPEQRDQFIQMVAYAEYGRQAAQQKAQQRARAPEQKAPNVGAPAGSHTPPADPAAEQTITRMMLTTGLARQDIEDILKGTQP